MLTIKIYKYIASYTLLLRMGVLNMTYYKVRTQTGRICGKCGTKRRVITTPCIKTRTEELHNLYALPHIIMLIKSNTRLVGEVDGITEIINAYKML